MVNSRPRSAFTIVEVLVVVAILATLAAILFPVFSRSKKEGFITKDVQKLHQCQLATALYQTDNDSGGVPPYHLPLPPDWLNQFKRGQTFYGTDAASWTSACGWHPLSNSPNFVFFADAGPDGVRAYALHGERTILIADVNCNEADVDVNADFLTKLGLGVLLDGTLVRTLHQGNVYSFYFWDEVSS
jgi:prepilin-type N-terminal cleavage/methylation domain-containing protein